MTQVTQGTPQSATHPPPSAGAMESTSASPYRRLFDRESLADYLRLSTDTIDRLVKAGRLPCVRIGSQVRFTSDDVDAFVESHRQSGSVAP
jgi:excisionase family DNA binding protein